MSQLFYLFFTPIVATIIPYLACFALDVPFFHGIFSIDIFILFCLLLTPRKNIIWSSVWALLLVLFAFFYEQSLPATIRSLNIPQWSDYFCATIYLAIIFFCIHNSKERKNHSTIYRPFLSTTSSCRRIEYLIFRF